RPPPLPPCSPPLSLHDALPIMALTDIWFLLIAVLWTGYFVLEGFDFGVGMLLPVVGRTDNDRRVAINTIGPVWDGNEVWLIVAGDRKSTRLNSSHVKISYAVFC